MTEIFKPILLDASKEDNGITLLTVDASKLSLSYFNPGIYMNNLEIKILAWSLGRVRGDYIEMGVNKGYTALNICKNNPKKTIYGVDWPYWDGSTMCPGQMSEMPDKENVAEMCDGLPNFSLILGNTRNVWIPLTVRNQGMVLIDGDHTYKGVKADTENVLEQVQRGTLIFWHDYDNNLHHDYIGVRDYIDNEIAPNMKLFQFRNTFLIAGIV